MTPHAKRRTNIRYAYEIDDNKIDHLIREMVYFVKEKMDESGL